MTKWCKNTCWLFVCLATPHKCLSLSSLDYFVWEPWAWVLAMPCWQDLIRLKQLPTAANTQAQCLSSCFFFGRSRGNARYLRGHSAQLWLQATLSTHVRDLFTSCTFANTKRLAKTSWQEQFANNSLQTVAVTLAHTNLRQPTCVFQIIKAV